MSKDEDENEKESNDISEEDDSWILHAFVNLFKCFWDSDKNEIKMVRLTNKLQP